MATEKKTLYVCAKKAFGNSYIMLTSEQWLANSTSDVCDIQSKLLATVEVEIPSFSQDEIDMALSKTEIDSLRQKKQLLENELNSINERVKTLES